MGKWIAVGVLAMAAWWMLRDGSPPPSSLAPAAYKNEGVIIRAESAKLRHTRELKYEAVSSAYTIVDISSDTCASCRQLDPQLEKFIEQRADVQLKVIKLPSPPQECMGGLTSEQFAACEPKLDAVRAEYKRLGVCHTPHVAVYDPRGKPIAEDSCDGRAGLDFVRRWLQESGVG